MNATNIKNILINGLSDFGFAMIVIIGSVLLIAVGFLVFKTGFQHLKQFDMSGRIGGFYYARTPWKGYNRFRSQKWNMEHMN